jgi:hypothetical protein
MKRSSVPVLVVLTLALVGFAGSLVCFGADQKGKPAPVKPDEPKRVTIKGDKVALSEALKQLAAQTDNPVEDRRQARDDFKMKLDIDKATFWEALEAICKEADAHVSLYEQDGKLAIQDGYRPVPVSFDGVFRTSVKRVTAVHDLEADARVYEAVLEVAWEPGFRPFFLETRPEKLVVLDDKKRPLDTPADSAGRVPIEGNRSKEFTVRLPAPPRSVASFASVKGQAGLIGPNKWLTFKFDNLEKIKADPKTASQEQEGVQAKLSRLDFRKDIWNVEVTLDYPADGPALESFESFIVHNECYLTKKGTEFPNGGYETSASNGTRVKVTYHFPEEKDKKLGSPADWTLVYQTPGPLASFPVNFEFKDLPLP